MEKVFGRSWLFLPSRTRFGPTFTVRFPLFFFFFFFDPSPTYLHCSISSFFSSFFLPCSYVPSLFDFLATICGQSRHRPRVWCSFLFIHLVWFSFKVSFGYFLSINIDFQLSLSFVFFSKKGIFSPARIRAPIMLSNPSFRVSKQGIW